MALAVPASAHALTLDGTTAPASPVLATEPAMPGLGFSGAADLGYSSSAGAAETAAAENFDFKGTDETQPPPRRRYGGRPNYADTHTNADGSSKFAFMAGAGIALPVEDSKTYLTPSYAFQVGAGRNFSKMFGVLLQFDYDHFGFTGATLASQSNLYFGSTNVGLDGSSHVWSFTVDPMVTFHGTDRTSAYFVGGAGFYHKTANFTVPSTGTYCDPYYGCFQYQANATYDKYTSNAVGFNGGLGFTYKPSRFSGERFYVEGRFVFVDNQLRAFSATHFNFYPPNANQTYYVPVTFGLRW